MLNQHRKYHFLAGRTKKGRFGVHNQSVCLTLFSVLGERDSFTGTSVPPVEAFSAIPFFPPSPLQQLMWLLLLHPVHESNHKQTNLHKPTAQSPPPIPASRDQHRPVYGTGSTAVSAIWLHNLKSFSNQLNDGSYTCYTS